MVDVGDKSVTRRRAVAEGWIVMQPETLKMIQKGDHKKGDVLSVARIAGIMAAKKTAELIPLCHPLMLTSVTVELEIQESSQAVRCEVASETTERTGVEMEALTAVSVACLTIYDMLKAADKHMVIGEIMLTEKTGGKSGDWTR